MAIIDAARAAERWSQGMQGASTKYKEGVDAVSESPMERAAANQQGYLNGVMEAVNSGKWANGLRRVSLQEWKEKAKNVGAQRLASGAMAAKPKMQAFLAAFLPFLQTVTDRVRSMPASTYEERKARANAQMDGVHTFRR